MTIKNVIDFENELYKLGYGYKISKKDEYCVLNAFNNNGESFEVVFYVELDE